MKLRQVDCPLCGQGFYLSTDVIPPHADQRRQGTRGRGLLYTEAELPRCPAGGTPIEET